ncbi:hypothetical protein [Luteimonas deserti]|uniref:Uncharacterized protein n=1 Tax=Luteimonas deserti TaxID=2752306 RepID=A0A7Z0QNY0_9GAMM|nr:hypothetical protein [Luteimonas deserti]NYZ62109.1 hypothetical protein [Luteimonas deserti]
MTDFNYTFTANITTNAVNRGEEAAAAGGGGKGWLAALAGALGGMLGDRAVKMETMMEKLNDLNAELDGLGENDQAGREQNTREFQTTLTAFQAESQMFSILSNASSTALKSIGEGVTAVARKQ